MVDLALWQIQSRFLTYGFLPWVIISVGFCIILRYDCMRSEKSSLAGKFLSNLLLFLLPALGLFSGYFSFP